VLADVVNGSLECLAGFVVLLHCRVLHRDKEVRGVSLPAVFFFCGWGFWNLWYYPHLGQFFSFIGGILVVFSNTLWLLMMLYYNRRNGDGERG